jgi:HAD superfamily hydrolase (TIGR01493 family)
MEGIRACVFDAYGTLFDVHSAVARLRPRIGPGADDLSTLWRTKQLEYTWLRALMGAMPISGGSRAMRWTTPWRAPGSTRRCASR